MKYIIYKLSDDYKEIVVEDYSSDDDWDAFRNKLLNAKAGYKGKEGKGPRYAVYDFQWDLASGEGTRFAHGNESPMLIVLTNGSGTRLCSSHGRLTREHLSLYATMLSTTMDLTNALQQPRMTYASSKEALKNALSGVGSEVQANGDDAIEYDTILRDVSKGTR